MQSGCSAGTRPCVTTQPGAPSPTCLPPSPPKSPLSLKATPGTAEHPACSTIQGGDKYGSTSSRWDGPWDALGPALSWPGCVPAPGCTAALPVPHCGSALGFTPGFTPGLYTHTHPQGEATHQHGHAAPSRGLGHTDIQPQLSTSPQKHPKGKNCSQAPAWFRGAFARVSHPLFVVEALGHPALLSTGCTIAVGRTKIGWVGSGGSGGLHHPPGAGAKPAANRSQFSFRNARP